MRICIVTPGQLGSNPRVVKEANALVDAGHQVTVVSTKVISVVEPRDQAVMVNAPFAVHRVPFDRPLRWRLARLRQEAARCVARAGALHRAAAGAISAMVPGLTRAALAVRADLYIAHYPAALPAAACAARHHNGRFAFDAEDFHLGDLPDLPEHAFDKALIRALESRWLPEAAFVTAASPMIAGAYAETYAIGLPKTVLNTFPRTGAAPAPTAAGSQQPGPTLYWFSQVIGPGRGLECAVRALALAAAPVHLYLRGTPARGYAETLRKLAEDLDLSDRLHLLDPIAPAALEADGARFDLGYAGELPETHNHQIALANKLFSYLSSGLPIVASLIPSHEALARELGQAVRLFEPGDPAALAAAIDAMLTDPDRLAAARRYAWGLGQDRFSWDVESSRLVDLVAGLETPSVSA